MLDKFSNSFNLLVEKLSGWWDAIILNLPNLIVALIVVALMAVASRYVRKWIRKTVGKFSDRPTLNKLISNLAAGVLVFLALILVLNIMNLQETVTSLLAGAGIAGLVIGLAVQDALSNTFAGVMLSVNELYNLEDHVKIADLEGMIEKIGMRFTQIRTFDGQIIIIPNKKIINDPVINYTLINSRRIDISCGVSYGDDLSKAEEIACDAIKNNITFDKSKGVDFLYDEFGDSSINFKIRFWIPNNDKFDFLQTRSHAIKAIKNAFDKHDIVIPFPIRTMDFGVRGGKELNKVLEPVASTVRVEDN